MVAAKIEGRAISIGNKSANLEALASLFQDEPRTEIPAFSPLTHELIQAHLDTYSPGWRRAWEKFKEKQGDENAELTHGAKVQLGALRSRIQRCFREHELNSPELSAFLEKMQQSDTKLMVRSTGEEDTVELANPGGNESIAAVEATQKEVSNAVGQVVASYFSEKSLKQRLLSPDNDITKDAFTPVLLQRMIGEPLHGFQDSNDIVRSGVMYTGQATTQIQVAPGHGELVVNSKAACDTFTVTRENMVYSEIAQKPRRLVPTEQGLQFTNNPQELQNTACLSQSVAQRLAALGHRIEAHYGMPMDVEFIYDPKDDVISVVQARPIPAGDLKTIIASSVPAEKIPELKQVIKAGAIQKVNTHVISPAGYVAKIITQPNQVLICNTLEEALTQYLAQSNSPVQAVIVKHPAPSTSHEAAVFNSKAIPVVQMDEISLADAWVKRDASVLMLDPQRNQLLDVTSMVDDPNEAKSVLEACGFLGDGLFAHPVAPTTPQPLFTHTGDDSPGADKTRMGDLIQHDPNAALKLLYSKLKPVPLGANIYSQLLTNLESMEAMKEHDENKDALIALNTTRYIFYRLAKAEPAMLPVFQQAMVVCEEIERSMSRTDARAEQLNLVARLKSLVTYPGNKTIFSDSIKQVMQEKKSASLASPEEKAHLTQAKIKYITQFLKLSKLAFNDNSKQAWKAFVLNALKDNNSIQKLAVIVKFYVENNLESKLINQHLTECTQQAPNLDVALQRLYNNCMQSKQELENLNLKEKQSTIQAWEQRLPEWGQPQQFDALWRSYEQEIVPLVTQLSLSTPFNLVVLSELPEADALQTIPGEAEHAFVKTDNGVFYVDKARGYIESFPGRDLTSGDISLPELGHAKSLSATEYAVAVKQLKFDEIMSNLSVLATEATLEPSEILDMIKTRFAYVLSGEDLYFVDTSMKTCSISNLEPNTSFVYEEIVDTLKEKYQGNEPSDVSGTKGVFYLDGRDKIKECKGALSNLSTLTQDAISSAALKLTDVMDNTIKALKGSPEYTSKDQVLLVERFAQLLEPYHALMRQWMSTVPDGYYDQWAMTLDARQTDFNSKRSMLAQIKGALDHSKRDLKQLTPSNAINIAATKIGSGLAFGRQFVQQKDQVTLEDLFSLMHQNTLASIGVLGDSTQIPLENLPEPLKPLLQTFQQENSLKLLNLSHDYPNVELEYNWPLANHGMTYLVTYNQETHHITLAGHICGQNGDNRMGIIAETIDADQQSLGCDVKKEPVFEKMAKAVAFTWEFKAGALNEATSHTLLNTLNDYAARTYERPPRPPRKKIAENTTSSFKQQLSALKEGASASINNKPHEVDEKKALEDPSPKNNMP